MTNVDGVRAAIRKYIETTPSDHSMIIMLQAHDAAILHLTLEIFQEMIERSTVDATALEGLGKAREAVEKALRQTGYGRDR